MRRKLQIRQLQVPHLLRHRRRHQVQSTPVNPDTIKQPGKTVRIPQSPDWL